MLVRSITFAAIVSCSIATRSLGQANRTSSVRHVPSSPSPGEIRTPDAPSEGSDDLSEPSDEAVVDVDLGLDLVTRLVWRGVAFGDQWTLQPSAGFTAHGFGVSVWASAAPDQRSLVDFMGVTVDQTFEGDWGALTFEISDWIVTQREVCDAPDPVDPTICTTTPRVDFGAPYLFDIEGDGDGSHWIDANVYLSGPESFPIEIQFGVVVYNDPYFSKYLGLLYEIDLGRGFALTPELGLVFGESEFWYQTDDDPVNVTNVALTLARTVELSHGLTVPLSVLVVVNPESQRAHVVGSIGIGL